MSMFEENFDEVENTSDMKEPLFESKVTKVESDSESFTSFKDCPNGCIDGYYINPYEHKKYKCLYCASKRKEVVRENLSIDDGKSIGELLNLPKSFIGYSEFRVDSIIPEFASKVMIADSVNKISKVMQDMINSISIGDIPDYSIMFNLGQKAFEDNFIHSYLFRAYESGRSVAPYTSSYDLYFCRLDAEKGSMEARERYETLLKSDVCFIVIDAGASHDMIMSVKGLMQLRASKDRSTLIVTNVWNRVVKELVSEDDGNYKNLAKLYSIEYTQKFVETEEKREEALGVSKPISTRAGMSQKSFDELMRPKNSW